TVKRSVVLLIMQFAAVLTLGLPAFAQQGGVNQQAANTAPLVNTGAPIQIITLPAAANLSGTASDDGLPSGTLQTLWSQIGGPGAITFANASALNTTATVSTAGRYTLRLRADDGGLFYSCD